MGLVDVNLTGFPPSAKPFMPKYVSSSILIIGNPELYDPTDTCWLTVGQHITNTCICKTNRSQFSQEEQNVVRHGSNLHIYVTVTSENC